MNNNNQHKENQNKTQIYLENLKFEKQPTEEDKI